MCVSQITTTRKAVTLLLSYMIFTKPLTEQHRTGLLLIGMGITMKLLPENKPPQRLPKPAPSTQMTTNGKQEEDGDEEKRPLKGGILSTFTHKGVLSKRTSAGVSQAGHGIITSRAPQTNQGRQANTFRASFLLAKKHFVFLLWFINLPWVEAEHVLDTFASE
ncbi:hypothetical protein G4B88_020324 [Cannabis sativa]|uniref:Uncharacterized protein n=1 Tax=Cannabis sativa TaxID=3483 RepID=A0A7J6EAF2_CANSA|nr:hypothetical protein G4B88_020324 [Cannabis sativa]